MRIHWMALAIVLGAAGCSASSAAQGTAPAVGMMSSPVAATMCSYGADDVTAIMNELARAVAARKPGGVHSYVMVASFGQTPNAQVLETLFQQIKTTYVDTGLATWRKITEIIDLVKAQRSPSTQTALAMRPTIRTIHSMT